LCASVAGFSLHAAQAVPAFDREALERLLRYGLRAPFSQERLSRREDGKVLYRLRRPWPNPQGATHLLMDPVDFLRRLAALISYPRSHQTRRHGVFANRSRFRRRLPPPPPPEPRGSAELMHPETTRPEPATATGTDATVGASVRKPARYRLSWAQLLRRVLSVDALSCPRCSRRMEPVPMTVLAFITDSDVVRRILSHLHLPTSPPPLAKARIAGSPLAFPLEDGEMPALERVDAAMEAAGAEECGRPPPGGC
jgi:hypothetical protein